MSELLANLVKDPDRLGEVPPESIPALRTELAAVHAEVVDCHGRRGAQVGRDPNGAEVITSSRWTTADAIPEGNIPRKALPGLERQKSRARKSKRKGGETGMQLITEEEAARRLCCTVAALRRWRREGRGPRFVRLGRLIRYSDEDLCKFVNESTEPTRKRALTVS